MQSAYAMRLVAFALFCVAASVHAQNNVTLSGGYRGSSGLTEATTGRSINLDAGPGYAMAVNFGIDRSKQWEILYSHQRTVLSSGGLLAANNNLTLDVDYLHFGGNNYFDSVDRGAYVVGGLGVTLLRPDRPGTGTETRPSLNLGFGYLVPFGKNFGLRFEARGYVTLLGGSSAMFCSGGCAISISGDALFQAEALAGVTLRF